jgi:hypothetical protein
MRIRMRHFYTSPTAGKPARNLPQQKLRISLDLDDGVKVNYGKCGDLLAEVKAVTGGKDEE